jgi:hypothetical protein
MRNNEACTLGWPRSLNLGSAELDLPCQFRNAMTTREVAATVFIELFSVAIGDVIGLFPSSPDI